MAAKIDYDKMDIVLAVYSTEEADDISAELVLARIPYARRKIGAGKAGNFLMAMNNYGEEIFVYKEDMDRAKEVIEEWRKKRSGKRAEEAAAGLTDEEEHAQKRQVKYARFYAAVVLVIVVVIFIIQNR